MSDRTNKIAEIKGKLGSDNPDTRAQGILALARCGISDPDLVEPLVNDTEPFMFGVPVLVLANAYLQLIGEARYEGIWADMVDAETEDLRRAWNS